LEVDVKDEVIKVRVDGKTLLAETCPLMMEYTGNACPLTQSHCNYLAGYYGYASPPVDCPLRVAPRTLYLEIKIDDTGE
jgi:hypothetical protein